MNTTENTNTRKPGDVSYEACVTAEEGKVDVLITRNVVAGVCGPFGGFTLDREASMGEVSAELVRLGYAPVSTDEWRAVVCFDGMRLYATLGREGAR